MKWYADAADLLLRPTHLVYLTRCFIHQKLGSIPRLCCSPVASSHHHPPPSSFPPLLRHRCLRQPCLCFTFSSSLMQTPLPSHHFPPAWGNHPAAHGQVTTEEAGVDGAVEDGEEDIFLCKPKGKPWRDVGGFVTSCEQNCPSINRQ
ncbi:hypothetical protein NQZ68_025122 [Dissostichus eleginoides]|nr:hypothetical protein NQZ68_025122 [Dissostichus eleginoides]